MAEIRKRTKPLAVNPLKTSQPMGASLALLGVNGALPILHGAQGCTAFAKVFFVRHFREPIPLQSTAMDQVSSIMGADDNIVAALKSVCEKAKPAALGLFTTSLAEVEGADIHRVIKRFRSRCPEHQGVRLVAVNTPDFDGCLETGYAAAVRAMVDGWVPAAQPGRPGRSSRQVNVLAGSLLTPGDLEALKELIISFGLYPVVIPDLADSLDGHLAAADFSPITTGGAPVAAFAALGDAAATLVIGASLSAAADLLRERTGVPDYRFDHLLGLEATDALIMTLGGIAGAPVPPRLERQRAQLQDAMLDTHFLLGQSRCAIAGDPDLLNAFSHLLGETGVEIVAAVAPSRAPVLERVPVAEVQIGDLEDLENLARQHDAEFIISNSHAAETAQRLNLPLLRAGFPLHDRIGAYQRTWIGYQGARQALFDLANLLLSHDQHEIAPYHAFYSAKSDFLREAPHHELAAASADCGQRH